MKTIEVLAEIRRIVEDQWETKNLPVLLSSLPRKLEGTLGPDYKAILADKGLKTFLQENFEEAGVQVIQDSEHHARVGIIPQGQKYVFPPLAPSPSQITAPSAQITAADARAFAKVLDSMTAEERRAVMLPASFVARLLTAK